METPDAVLDRAAAREQGRRALNALSGGAKDTAESARVLALSLHKYAANEAFDCSGFAFDTPDEELLFRCLHDAQVALGQARELVTARLVLATTEAVRARRD